MIPTRSAPSTQRPAGCAPPLRAARFIARYAWTAPAAAARLAGPTTQGAARSTTTTRPRPLSAHGNPRAPADRGPTTGKQRKRPTLSPPPGRLPSALLEPGMRGLASTPPRQPPQRSCRCPPTGPQSPRHCSRTALVAPSPLPRPTPAWQEPARPAPASLPRPFGSCARTGPTMRRRSLQLKTRRCVSLPSCPLSGPSRQGGSKTPWPHSGPDAHISRDHGAGGRLLPLAVVTQAHTALQFPVG